MQTATDSANPARSLRLVRVVLLTWILVAPAGCAGFTSWTTPIGAVSERFWKSPSSTNASAGYDFYSESLANSRKRGLGEEERIAAAGGTDGSSVSPGGGIRRSAAGNPSNRQLAGELAAGRPEAPNHVRSATRGQDTAVRVTLGRPESLPVLGEPPAASGRLLADTRRPSTNTWKRPGDTDPSRPRSDPTPGQLRRAASIPVAATLPAPRQSRREADRTPQDDPLREILSEARRRLETMSTYQVHITRVERVGGQLQPEEDVVLSIRRSPRAVRLEWAQGPNKGREVIYSAAINDRMMYINMANSAIPLPRMTIPVDSPLALRNSRHPITEAGFDTIFDNLTLNLAAVSQARGSHGTLQYHGITRLDSLDATCHLIERITPRGETWKVYLDTQSLMPVQVTASRSDTGELIERYTYQNLVSNPDSLASAEAFDPDKRWGESKNWLSRLARAAGPDSSAKTDVEGATR